MSEAKASRRERTMKSNEEFIAGIYEKAAVYTEEKDTKIIKVNFAAKAARIAAMVVLCVGLAGAGVLALGRNGGKTPNGISEQASEDYGIALLSEDGDENADSAVQFRISPVSEIVTFTGVVEEVDAEESRIWLRLIFDETAPASAKDSMVCIRWDVLEKIGEEIQVGTELTATGALSMYENETSENNGCAELVLTDMANLEIK